MEVLDFVPRVGSPRLPWEPIKLIPLGDIQAGVPACDLDLLQRTVDRGLREGAFFIGMGDYLDVASPSNRQKFKNSGFYDSVRDAMDAHMYRQEQALMDIIGPTRNRWIGMLEGHHLWEYQDGSTTDINLCKALNTKFLGDCAMVRLTFADANGHSVQCVIWGHHGNGSGITSGAPLNKLERVVEWAEADLYLMGHQHKRVAASLPRFYLTKGRNPTILARERLLVGCGSYLKGYMAQSVTEGRPGGTYVEQAMMRPVSLGSPIITITPVRHGDSYLIEFEVVT